MTTDKLLDELEAAVEAVPGVLGCVILAAPEGTPTEIQAFVRTGSNLEEVRRAILDEVAARAMKDALSRIFVFELDAEAHFGDRETLERAAELAEQEARARGPLTEAPAPSPTATAPPRRPVLSQVVLRSAALDVAEAEVVLGPASQEVVGQAVGEKTPLGLRLLAQATLDAAGRLVREVRFSLVGAALVAALNREAVIVVVRDGDLETVGAALVREGPISETTVRATLDAINRRLMGT